MFLFKKIVSQFFFPMPLCLACCFAGVALIWWSKKQKAGSVLVVTGLMLLTALSYGPLADGLLRPFEQQFGRFESHDPPNLKYVVVLGGGHSSDPDLPASSRLTDASIKRLVEGICIYRQNPGSKLILSGGTWLDPIPEATVLAEVAMGLGVSSHDIVLEDKSRDTEEQARLVGAVVTTNSFALVTSANHMPRALRLFKSQQLAAYPAAAEHLVKHHSFEPGILFPNSHALRQSEAAFYETMGQIWLAVRKRFNALL